MKNILQTNLLLCRFAQTENLEVFFVRQSCLREGGAVWALSENLFLYLEVLKQEFLTYFTGVDLKKSKDTRRISVKGGT